MPRPPATTWTPPARLMGILNLTPDSFSDGGRFQDVPAAVAAARQMAEDGATWIDVGGESTRPGAAPVSAGEEAGRVLPVVKALVAQGLGAISIDTAKAAVAAAALAAGAALVNDVTAGGDPEMLPLVAERRCPIVLMHMQGEPRTMQQAPRYRDVVDEVCAFLEARMAAASRAGIAEQHLLLDPGLGFGKTTAHNLALLRALPDLARRLGRPLVVGLSRKRFLGRLAGVEQARDRDGLGHILHGLIAPWCAVLRVHDVRGARAALAEAAP